MMMELFALFLSLLVMVGLLTAYVKLATKILRHVRLSWFHCLRYSVIFASISLVMRIFTFITNLSFPYEVSIFYGLILNLVLGALYIGKYGIGEEGRVLGRIRGLQVGLLIFVLLAVTFMLLSLVVILVSLLFR